MLFTGTIEHVVIEIWEGQFFLIIIFRFEDSLIDFDKAIALEQTNPIIYSNRGLVNRKLENFNEAIQDYSNEITHSSLTNLKALNNRAYCYAKLG